MLKLEVSSHGKISSILLSAVFSLLLALTGAASAAPIITASPSSAMPGGSVTGNWSDIASPTARDWIGFYAAGTSNTAFLAWVYVSCSQAPTIAKANGSCALTLPVNLANGGYELRLLSNDGFTTLATSNAVTLGGAPLPVVDLVANAPTASETGPTPGTIRVSRTGSPTTDLAVNYTAGGTATNLTDYQLLNGATLQPLMGSVTIAAGQASVLILVRPVDDAIAENDETVVLTLSANTAYRVGSSSSATVTILDNDRTGASITGSPSRILQGANLIASWSGIVNPTAADWIGLYGVGAPNTAFLAWRYVNCNWSPTVSMASGSCGLTIPANLADGNYELRLLSNDGFGRLATSNPLSIGVVTKLVNVNREGNVINNLLPMSSGGFLVTTQLSGISANGRFVLFETAASDLVANDTNGTIDVFVRDLRTETTTLVSVNRFGTNSGNGESHAYRGAPGNSSISADGRFVVFTSWASDLVANDTNGQPDVFVRDLQTGTMTLVSVNRFGTNSGNSGSGVIGTGISADGRFAMFQSWASDLVEVESDTDGNGGIFVRDLQAGTTTLVTLNLNGTGSIGFWPVLSADGRSVAFNSYASDLVTNDTNGQHDVFVRDLQTGTTRMATVNLAGTDSGNIGSESIFALSADGRFVAFESDATDLVPNNTNQPRDVFVRNLQTGITTLVSVNSFGTNGGNHHSFLRGGISADGRFVAFTSWASDLVANEDTNGDQDVFVRDLQTGTTTLVSVNQFGTGSGNGGSWYSAISADGRFVAFVSHASDLVGTDTNDGAVTAYEKIDVFVRDVQTGTTTLMSVNEFGTDSGNAGYSFGGLALSADGRVVVFTSNASDLVANDTNGQGDIFVRPVRQ